MVERDDVKRGDEPVGEGGAGEPREGPGSESVGDLGDPSDSEAILAAEGASILEDALAGGFSGQGSLLERGEIPRAFDGLVLEELLGSGGTGEVYRARQQGIERQVAVKIRLARASDAPFADRLIDNEARNLAALDHPGIARIHAMGEVAGRRYLVLEYVAGVSLAQRIERSLPLDEALELFLGVARVLAAAHAQGLAHRDLKPSNILIAEGAEEQPAAERVRLIDFGLSGRLFTLEGAGRMGTDRYMAPEQLAGEVAGPPADIYALRRTFEHMVDDDWLRIPTPVRALLRRMGATDPADRPAAAEVVEVLESAPVSSRFRRWLPWAAACLFVPLLGWAGHAFWRGAGADAANGSAQGSPTGSAESLARLEELLGTEDLFEGLQERKQRFHEILSQLRRGDGKTLPISEEDLAFLMERAPLMPLTVHGQADRLLSLYGIHLPRSRWLELRRGPPK